MRFACLHRLAALCRRHCSTCVAQAIRGMMIRRHPHLPPVYHRQSDMSPQLNVSNISQGLRSLQDLTQHLTTRANDNHAPPVSLVTSDISLYLCKGCQGLVRFLALLRIKPHTPPLVRAPSIPLSFTLACILPRRRTYCVNCGTELFPQHLVLIVYGVDY